MQKPENHIKTASGKYVEKPVHIRQVHDMTDEMAQELVNLPRFQAYTKIIDESQNKQLVRTHKMQTHPLPKWNPVAQALSGSPVEQAFANGHTLGKTREAINEEIRERQSRWGRGGSPPQTKRLQD